MTILQSIWSKNNRTRKPTKVDETTSGVAVSYTMGSMSITANMNTADDYKGTAASEKETTEIAVSFSF